LFEEAGDIEIVAEAEDGDTTAALALTNQPDVLVTDIEMFGLNGL
jgi:YesN/AraC family two-component response regulator